LEFNVPFQHKYSYIREEFVTGEITSKVISLEPQPFYGPFSGTTLVSWCQNKIFGLYGARED